MATAWAAAHREARADLEGEWPLHGRVAQRHVPARPLRYRRKACVATRGTVAVTKAGLRRDKQLLEGQKPAQEHYTTIRNHAYEVHHIQRAKALTNSFAVKRSALQWDEASMNSLSWCVIVLNCVRSEGIREREVLSTTKLKPDVDGHAKTGVNVGVVQS